MRILLTGSSGFVGKNILFHLQQNKYNIKTIGRNDSNDIFYDFNSILNNLPDFEIIIHSAGKAHVLDESNFKIERQFDFNTIGTEYLLKSLSASRIPKYFVLISSVSVYGIESGEMVNENFPLNARDPYGLSKVKSENIVINWCKANNVTLTILRLPLVYGIDPPGNLGNMIKAIQNGYYFNINDGSVKKSMILVTDVPKFILLSYRTGGIYNLTDGYSPSFFELSHFIAKQFGLNRIFSIPFFIVQPVALFGDIIGNKFPINSKKVSKLINTLTFDDSKAQNTFNWNPTPILKSYILNKSQ
jgi:nucleoside-diphosphate-sugar epimerase